MAGRKQVTGREAWPDQVRDVATKLDGLLGELTATVDALHSILLPPPDDQAPGDVVEVAGA